MTTVLRWLWVLVGLGAIAAGGLLIAEPRAQRYVASRGYCERCHGEAVKHLGGHQQTACQSCHTMPQGQLAAQLWAVSGGGDAAMPKHGKLDESSCKACHATDPARWNALARSAGHASHALDPQLVKCVTCHGPSLHDKPAASERCESCHQKTITKHDATAQLDCLRCHVFGSGKASTAARQARATAPTWGSEITGANVHGAADCRLCHNPHREPGQADRAQNIDCTTCHRGDLARSVTHAPDNHKICTTCHRPHGLRAELATACAVCHQKPRVRGDERDPGVPDAMRALTTIAPLLAARTGPPTPPPNITHEGKCANCHEPHSWQPNKEICRTCHEKQAHTVEALPADTHRCLGCHEPHSPKPGKETCTQCHGDKVKSITAAPERHHDCLSCHKAHEGKPHAQIACGETCHKPQEQRLHDGQEKHRNCVNCHTPHAAPKPSAPLACQKCHEDKAKSFQGSKHETCINCHTNHEFNGPAALARCSSCHKAPFAPGASHKDTCTKCHTPHAPGRGPAANCTNCHKEIRPQVKTHQDCKTCHKPHLPKATASLQCVSCHTQKLEVAKTWPVNSPHSPGHCAQCHTKHDESKKVLCQSCHTDKLNPTHMGVHKECKGCHAPHLAVPDDAKSWWGRCATCHTKEAAAAATGNPKHQLCANCHNNPGRKPKQCIDCHSQIRQQGEHQQAKHDQCTNCHGTHGTSAPVRKACESCHKDRVNHFPDAPKCQSCHPFATKQ